MGKTSRKKYTPEFKAQVAIEALKEQSTLAELAKKYELSPTMISHWKADLLKNAGSVFGKRGRSEEEVEKKHQELYAKIGKLEMMLDFAKAGLAKTGDTDARRRIISPKNKKLTIEAQCFALGLARSTYYYKPIEGESEKNLAIMRKIDLQYM